LFNHRKKEKQEDRLIEKTNEHSEWVAVTGEGRMRDIDRGG
jgi:hypothetical protein